MPVATGVVEGTLAPAVIATLPMASQGCAAAGREGRDDPSLIRAEVRQLSRVLFEDLGQLRTLRAR
jgi:hypothetical protein